VISRNSKLTRFITKQAIDQFLHSIQQSLDDMPEAFTAEDVAYQEKCKKMLLDWRSELRQARDKLMADD
jgi:hypothetical protein